MLAGTSSGVVVSSDNIRRELFPLRRTYAPAETRKVNSEIKKRVRRALLEKQTVILDALFTKQRPRDEYRVLADSLDDEFVIVLVTAPESQVKARLEGRRPNADDPSEATYAIYVDRKAHFEPVAGEHIVVDNAASLALLSGRIEELAKSL